MSITVQTATLEQTGAKEVAMPVDLLHSFPMTHEQAVGILIDASWSPSELAKIKERCLATLFHPLGDSIRMNWWMNDKTFPLPRHYMKRFALGDPGDMVSLIILDFLAQLKKEPFNLAGYVHSFRQQWFKKGIDPLTLEKIPKTS